MLNLIRSIQKRDPVNPSFLEVILAYPGVHVLLFYRCSHLLWRVRLRTVARVISHIGRFFTGIEIHPGAIIGKRLFIDHGMGTVVGETAIVGDDVTLYHGVTLGGIGRKEDGGGRRHPKVGDNATIGAAAQVLGGIVIGSRAKVGAGAVVTSNVPDGCSAIGNPARLINCNEKNMPGYGFSDQTLPDPFIQRLGQLENDIRQLKKKTSPLRNVQNNDKSA